MRSVTPEILGSAFVKNVITLGSGNLIAQVITVASAPVISRLFEPAHFGVLAVFVSISSFITVISSMTYEQAIVLPSENTNALNVLVFSFAILFLTCSLCAVAALLFSPYFADALGSSELEFWLLFVPVAVFLRGAIAILRNWFVRQKSFRDLAAAGVLRSAVTVLGKIGAGFIIGAFTGGLIATTIIGTLAASLYMSFRALHARPHITLTEINYRSMIEQASRYRRFPIYFSFTALLNSVSQEIVVLLFAFLYSPAVVGLFHLSRKILQQPTLFISKSVSDVYFQKAAQQTSDGQDLARGFLRTTMGLALLAVVPFGFVAAFGRPFFSFVFGSNWAEAGFYAQILSPWLFFLFINRPANAIFLVQQKMEMLFIYNVAIMLARCAAVFSGYYFFKTASASLALFSAVGVAFNLFYVLYAYRLTTRLRRTAA